MGLLARIRRSTSKFPYACYSTDNNSALASLIVSNQGLMATNTGDKRLTLPYPISEIALDFFPVTVYYFKKRLLNGWGCTILCLGRGLFWTLLARITAPVLYVLEANMTKSKSLQENESSLVKHQWLLTRPRLKSIFRCLKSMGLRKAS